MLFLHAFNQGKHVLSQFSSQFSTSFFYRLMIYGAHLRKQFGNLCHNYINCHVCCITGGKTVDWRIQTFKKCVMYVCHDVEKQLLPPCLGVPGLQFLAAPSGMCGLFSCGCAWIAVLRYGCVCSVCSFLLCKGYLWIKHDWHSCCLCTLLPELYCSVFLFWAYILRKWNCIFVRVFNFY